MLKVWLSNRRKRGTKEVCGCGEGRRAGSWSDKEERRKSVEMPVQ